MTGGGGGDRCEQTTSGRLFASTCWGRCGSWSEVCRSMCGGRSVVPCSRCWPWQAAEPSPPTSSWTRCGHRRHRIRDAQPCTAKSPGCAGISGRGPSGSSPSTAGTGWCSPPTGWTWRGRRPSSTRPARPPNGDPAAARALLREALALWRGPAFTDLPEVTTLSTMAVGLERLRQEVTDLLVECAIDAGQVDGFVQLAVDALAADPLREPAALLLMRALASDRAGG